MPSVQLEIDHACYRIDSPDYEMVGIWLGDMLQLGRVNPATLLRIRVWPFFIPTDPASWTEPWVPDWTADSRAMETWAIGGAQSPAEAARKLAGKLAEFAEGLEEAAAEAE